MGLLLKLFSKKEPKSVEFIQSKNFRGFNKYKIANYDYPEAQENIKKMLIFNPNLDFKGMTIRLEFFICSTGTDALAVFVDNMRVGTIFFENGNWAALKTAFIENKISAVYVKANSTNDFYLFAKTEV